MQNMPMFLFIYSALALVLTSCRERAGSSTHQQEVSQNQYARTTHELSLSKTETNGLKSFGASGVNERAFLERPLAISGEVYETDAQRKSRLVKYPATAAALPAQVSRMITLEAEASRHLEEAERSITTSSGRRHSVVQLPEGRLSFTFLKQNETTRLRGVKKFVGRNSLIYSIDYHSNGTISRFMSREPEVGIEYYEDGHLKSFFIVLETATLFAEWDANGSLAREEQRDENRNQTIQD